MTLTLGDRTPITAYRRERPTLLERIHDLPETVADYMISGRDNHLAPWAFGAVGVLGLVLVAAQLARHLLGWSL